MQLATHKIKEVVEAEYKYGFVTDIESDTIPRGLSEDLVRMISAKKNEPEFMLAWRPLGGSYTVQTEFGYMVRIDGKDADVIGEVTPLQSPKNVAEAESPADLEKQIWDQLKTCFDPEIPVNIVDLGLVYSCDLHWRPDGKCRVEIKMTLTAPGCGMGGVIKDDAESKLMGLAGVEETDIEIVFEPQWDQSLMSEAAKLQLNLM